jgi:hypothetical protein
MLELVTVLLTIGVIGILSTMVIYIVTTYGGIATILFTLLVCASMVATTYYLINKYNQ